MNDLVPEARDGLRMREVGEEIFIYDARDDMVHVLNSTAAMILKLCDGSRRVADILHSLRSTFPDLAMSRLEEDLASTIKELERKGLVSTNC